MHRDRTHSIVLGQLALLLLLSVVSAAPLQAQGTLHIGRYYVAAHQVGVLQWNNLSGATGYEVYRQMPGAPGYTLLAHISDTHYVDTLHRTICGDTVGYYVSAQRAADTLLSDTVGLFYQDNVPTSPCRLRVCTVDTVLHRVELSWYASPDTDVMGYYICMGNPCRDFDTVWGRLNTTYLCDTTVDCTVENGFRILAFDSCYQASPLTQYYHNPVLHLSAQPCSRHLSVAWNQYINMPDSVARYCIYYRMQGSDSVYSRCFPAGGPYAFDMDVDNLAIGWIEAWVEVYNTTGDLMSNSVPMHLDFDQGDTARYLQVTNAVYDEATPSVALTFDIDHDFAGTDFYLMRSSYADTVFHQIATLHSAAPYTDYDINRAALHYTYRLDAPDICHQRVTSSDTLGVSIPPVGEVTAFFPNVMAPDREDGGQFCPYYLSAIADGYSMDIYTRWGERIFHTENMTDCWDGTHDGIPLPQGTYVYRVRCRHADGSNKIYSGNITILR